MATNTGPQDVVSQLLGMSPVWTPAVLDKWLDDWCVLVRVFGENKMLARRTAKTLTKLYTFVSAEDWHALRPAKFQDIWKAYDRADEYGPPHGAQQAVLWFIFSPLYWKNAEKMINDLKELAWANENQQAPRFEIDVGTALFSATNYCDKRCAVGGKTKAVFCQIEPERPTKPVLIPDEADAPYEPIDFACTSHKVEPGNSSNNSAAESEIDAPAESKISALGELYYNAPDELSGAVTSNGVYYNAPDELSRAVTSNGVCYNAPDELSGAVTSNGVYYNAPDELSRDHSHHITLKSPAEPDDGAWYCYTMIEDIPHTITDGIYSYIVTERPHHVHCNDEDL